MPPLPPPLLLRRSDAWHVSTSAPHPQASPQGSSSPVKPLGSTAQCAGSCAERQFRGRQRNVGTSCEAASTHGDDDPRPLASKAPSALGAHAPAALQLPLGHPPPGRCSPSPLACPIPQSAARGKVDQTLLPLPHLHPHRLPHLLLPLACTASALRALALGLHSLPGVFWHHPCIHLEDIVMLPHGDLRDRFLHQLANLLDLGATFQQYRRLLLIHDHQVANRSRVSDG